MASQTWTRTLIAWGLMGLCTGCGQVSTLSPTPALIQEHKTDSLPYYQLNTETPFQIHTLTPIHQDLVDQALADFESELIAGQVEAYFSPPEFAVQLLAGSEGSYLQDQSEIDLHQELTYAQALVVSPNQKVTVYKGQLIEGVFYFSGNAQPGANYQVYLLVLDAHFQPLVIQGELLAGSEGSYFRSRPRSAGLNFDISPEIWAQLLQDHPSLFAGHDFEQLSGSSLQDLTLAPTMSARSNPLRQNPPSPAASPATIQLTWDGELPSSPSPAETEVEPELTPAPTPSASAQENYAKAQAELAARKSNYLQQVEEIKLPTPPPPPPGAPMMPPPIPIEHIIQQPYHADVNRLIDHFIEVNSPQLNHLKDQPRATQWQMLQELWQTHTLKTRSEQSEQNKETPEEKPGHQKNRKVQNDDQNQKKPMV